MMWNLEFVPARGAVVALVALEGFVVQMDALVSHQVALLHEPAPAHAADVTARSWQK